MASKLSMKNNLNNELTITHSDDTLPITVDSVDLSKVIKINSLSELRDKIGYGKHKPPTIWISGYHTKGDNAFGSHIFEWDENCTENHNGGTIIDPDAIFPTDWSDYTQVNNWYNYGSITSGRYKLRYNGTVNVKWFGAKGDGIADDTYSIVSSLNYLQNGYMLDLNGGSYSLFNNINDIPTYINGEACDLNKIPRLYNKANITIQNGRLYAFNPKTGSSKYLFPTTLSIEKCENVILKNLILESKGENYGNTDISSSLSLDDRVKFAEQNGGHALLIVRSKNTKVINVKTLRCGSVSPFYIMSSDRTIATNCYSSPMSLGYAAFACDGWAGDNTEVGFDEFYTELNNCSTDSNGATYGSKNGVLIEDNSVICSVNGGIYKDCYANEAAHQLGAAFGASSAKLYVNGAVVKNCAAIGYSSNTTYDKTLIKVSNTKGEKLRTSMHIQSNTSFGNSEVSYTNCTADIIGGTYWSETELSIPTVIANMKEASHISVELNNCTVSGASTLSVNSNGCYGGITINGGEYTLKNRIFDSNGWGGATSNSNKGFIIKNGAYFEIMNDIIDASLLNSNVNSLCYIKNKDGSNVLTYLYIDFDINSKVVSRSSNFYSFSAISLQGSGLKEKEINDMELINCYDTMPTKERKNNFVVFISKTGTAGSLSKVILKFPENRVTGIAFFDDSWEMRIIEGVVSAIDVSNNDVRQELYISDTSDNLTENKNYVILA